MPKANLNRNEVMVNDGLDSIVIVRCTGDIPGGRTLDVSGLPAGTEFVKSGHILIIEDATKTVKPLNITAGAYDSIPTGHSYLGVNKYTVTTKDPRVGILTQGQVNAAASPAPVTSAIKAALPCINFLY